MQKFSDFNKVLFKTWIPIYLVLMIHGSTLTQVDRFLFNFMFAPIFVGASLAYYEIKFRPIGRKSREILQHFGIPEDEKLAFIIMMALYIVVPIGLVSSAMIYAEQVQSYDRLIWLPYCFGGVLIKEVIEEIYDSYFLR